MQSPKPSIAWVVGASGGIGAAIAQSLARLGINVAVGYFANQELAEQVAEKCKKWGVRSQPVQVDVRHRKSIQQAYQFICQEIGAPTHLIHAGGQTHVGLIQDISDEDYDQIMDVHVRGAIWMIQSVLPPMIREKEGRIILISSIWGETGGAGETLYSTAKAAQLGLVKALAKELAPSQITVNAVTPGAIRTALLDHQLPLEDQETLAEEIPSGRLGKPEEVAAMVAYLATPAASYVTGQVLRVNGGWYT
ncbi:elongation factor P 5-aminopentanone reductase [Hazenella coriacea]|nr:SDR family oxidoreductase [Hazenella coriacea]